VIRKIQVESMRRAGGLAIATAAVAGMLALALVGVAGASGGAHTQSFTETFHGTLTNELNEQIAQERGEEYEPPVNPCTGNELQVVEDVNLVNHITFFPAGDEVWATFTQTSRLTATEEASGVSYTGHATFWGNFNVNRQNENSTFTGTIRARGSNGSTLTFHEVSHFALRPDGKVAVSFEKPRVTCTEG
jgi:hypothetical protein